MNHHVEARPHILDLTTTDGLPYDSEEDAHVWDYAELTCPYQPPSELMPCAVMVPCGCPDPAVDPTVCPKSVTGHHRLADGEMVRPDAECWAAPWTDGITEAAHELGLPPGRYEVEPEWVDDTIRFTFANTETTNLAANDEE
jgi:hypothetical protein